MPSTIDGLFFFVSFFRMAKIAAGCIRVAELAEPATQFYACARNDYTLFRGNCYKAYGLCQIQPAAEAQCVADGGQLASIHSRDENTFVSNLAAAISPLPCAFTTDIWISLENIGVLGSPATANFVNEDGSVYDFANWEFGMPGYDGNCCITRIPSSPLAFQWNDVPCTATSVAYSVCKQPAILVDG